MVLVRRYCSEVLSVSKHRNAGLALKPNGDMRIVQNKTSCFYNSLRWTLVEQAKQGSKDNGP